MYNGILMKKITLILLVFLTIQCGFDNYRKFSINKNEIESISITNGFDYLGFKLTESEKTELISLLNTNQVNGPTKYMKTYLIRIDLKNDSIIRLDANNSIISTSDFKAYELKKTSNLDSFWKKINGNDRQLTRFVPTVKVNDKLIYENMKEIDSLGINNIKQVLDYYGIENRINNNSVFYKGYIEKELIWNYTTKSRDNNWLKEHKE